MPDVPGGYQLQCNSSGECPAGESCQSGCCVFPSVQPTCGGPQGCGNEGQPCGPGGCCNGTNLYCDCSQSPPNSNSCSPNICRQTSCTVGMGGCGCASGSSCSNSACCSGLCANGYCTDGPCSPGPSYQCKNFMGNGYAESCESVGGQNQWAVVAACNCSNGLCLDGPCSTSGQYQCAQTTSGGSTYYYIQQCQLQGGQDQWTVTQICPAGTNCVSSISSCQ